jgi:hypothetical protein
VSDGPALIRESIVTRRFACGPLDVTLRAQDPDLCAKIAETLELYDFTWPPPRRPVSIAARRSNAFVPAATGSFLHCARMLVDSTNDGLRASTTSGARASARFDATGETWHITVSDDLVDSGKLEEIEDVLSLVLTSGWRRGGWTPIHGAAVVKDQRCVVICAPTGGGKTTLTAALVRRGWRVLGDDKLLLRIENGRPLVAALLHTFNLHPKSSEWFPEVGDLDSLPRYSMWTEKRKVSVSSIWSHAPAASAEPSVLIALQRCAEAIEPIIAPLEHRDILTTLLRQTVIPCEKATARAIVSTVAGASAHLRGLHVEVPTDAYRDPRFLRALESALDGRLESPL